jgi:hypothetical protein
MAIEDKILQVLGRGAITWDGLRAELGATPGKLDAAIRHLETAREISRDRGRFHLNGATEPTANNEPAQAFIVEEPVTTSKKKSCSSCGVEKPLGDFPENKECRDGHSNQCKKCISEKAKARKLARLGSAPLPITTPLAPVAAPKVLAPKASFIPPVMILSFQDGVRIGPVHISDTGVAQMPYHVDISAEQLDELTTYWLVSKKGAA